MKKNAVTMILIMVLLFTAGVSPVLETKAEEADAALKKEVEAELSETAAYMMGQVKENVITNGNPISYMDYQDVMFCLKAGVVDKEAISFLNDALSSHASDVTDFLNPYKTEGMQTYIHAVTILYLQEIGEDEHSYAGVDFTARLMDSYEKETISNPYVYPYLNAAASDSEVRKKVAEDVFAYYVSDATGTGIDYWGVSADNNGQVLTALTDEYKNDEAVRGKINAALDWNAAQRDADGAIVSWGAPNPNATALALRAAAEFGRMEEAKGYYEALKQFASKDTPGAYTYMGEDSIFSSRDALTGLLAYRNALEGKTLLAVTDTYKKQLAGEETTNQQEKKEEPAANGTDNPAGTENKADVSPVQAPKTGDGSRTIFFATLLAMSIAVPAAVKGGRRKDGKIKTDNR